MPINIRFQAESGAAQSAASTRLPRQANSDSDSPPGGTRRFLADEATLDLRRRLLQVENCVTGAVFRNIEPKEAPTADAFERSAKAISDILKAELWRACYTNVENYAKKRWNVGRSHLYRLKDAWTLLSSLQGFPMRPGNERQCRAVIEESKAAELDYVAFWQFLCDQLDGNPALLCLPAIAWVGRLARGDCGNERHEVNAWPIVVQGRTPKKRKGSPTSHMVPDYFLSSAESEWNTPETLCNLVRTYFGGAVALDAASNPESSITCMIYYGRQVDGSFIDALKVPIWDVGDAGTCFLNPPGGFMEGHQSRQAAFIDKLLDQSNRNGRFESIYRVPPR